MARPWDKVRCPKNIFSAPRASVWSKNKRGPGRNESVTNEPLRTSVGRIQAQQVAANPPLGRFSTETPVEFACVRRRSKPSVWFRRVRGPAATQATLEWERRLEIQREQRKRKRRQETSELREHRLAQQGNTDNKRQRNRRLEYKRHYDEVRRTFNIKDVGNVSSAGLLYMKPPNNDSIACKDFHRKVLKRIHFLYWQIFSLV